MENDDLVDWADLAALRQLARESCNGPHPVRIFLSWLDHFKPDWLGAGCLRAEARIAPCAVCGEYDPHGWREILQKTAKEIRVHHYWQQQADQNTYRAALEELLKSQDRERALARASGITFEAVKEILSLLEGEEISFSRAVERLRELLLSSAEEIRSDLMARRAVDQWLLEEGRYLRWGAGAFYLVDTPAEVVIEGFSYPDLVEGIIEAGK